jgi:hypothetical protein
MQTRLILLSLISTPALAQSQHEVNSALSSGALSWFSAGRTTDDGRYKVQSIDLYLGYRYDVGNGVQLGGQVSFFREKITGENGITASDAGTSTQYRLMAGPTFNFGSEALNDAYYFEVLAGFNAGKFDELDLDKDFIWRASLGKRFALADNVSYSPNLSYRRIVGDSRFSQELRLNYLVLSVFF